MSASRAARAAPRRVYGGRSDDQRRAERRERLLAAGLQLYGTVGYAKTTIEALCAEAKVTARHFYEAFDGREALLVAVYDRVIAETRAQVVRAVSEALASSGSAGDMLALARAGVAAFVHGYVDDPRHVRIACIECVGVSPELERHRREVMHEFARLIEAQAAAMARAGGREPSDLGLTALALAGGTNELLVEWASRRTRRPPPERIIDELVRLYVAALAG